MERRSRGHVDDEAAHVPRTLSDDSVHAFGFDLSEDGWVARVHAALTACDDLATEPIEHPGQRVGPYELLDRIGTGGMGTVWRARRADKRPDRVVALKLIRRGMDSRSALRRFRLEEQVLARLEHPNIARLYDGGATAEGRPYLVMQYVEGAPIVEYAKHHDLTVEQRLELFRQVCDAVQYAHGSLVLHRDIKPSNIVVTDDGLPRLLDFGIAKILDDADDAAVSITATDARVLTPRYASPEQLRGERLSIATDVYSLGVVLFELLAGCSPYRVDSGTRRELELAILEQDPIKPSSAVMSRSDLPDRKRRALARRLRGEPDAICRMALQKEPASRYRSAQELGEDIHRHLQGLPLLARPPGPVARLVRVVRRRRSAIVTASIGVAVGVALAAFYIVQAFLVPGWIDEHVRAAHFAIVGMRGNAAFYNVLFFNNPGYQDRTHGRALSEDKVALARSEYEAALRLDGDNVMIRYELAMLELAEAIQREPDAVERVLAPLSDEIPLTYRVAREWLQSDDRPSLPQEALDAASVLDLRCLGLFSLFYGDYATMMDGWTRLPIVSADPLVEGLLGRIHLALDEPELAYPRLLSAYRAYPKSGDLAVYLADAAVRCGDVHQTRSLLDQATGLSQVDGNLAAERVEALYHLARGEEEAALVVYRDAMLSPMNAVAVVQLAQYYEEAGELEAALRTLAERTLGDAVEHVSCEFFVKLMEAWWTGLDEKERVELTTHGTLDAPEDADDFAAFLRSYRNSIIKLDTFFPEPHPLFHRSRWTRLAAPIDEAARHTARGELLELASELPEHLPGSAAQP